LSNSLATPRIKPGVDSGEMGHHGTTDKSAQGNGAPRIFHYTVVEHYNKIVRDAVIRPARRVASGRATSRLVLNPSSVGANGDHSSQGP
jgi:hypothetical protein